MTEKSCDRVPTAVRPLPSRRKWLWVWAKIGISSFGGGATTLYYIRREVVETQRWMTDEEFVRNWNLCQLAPGINLLGVTILIGLETGGVVAAVIALFGMLIPSALITLALTVIYQAVQTSRLTQAAIDGVVPATVGIGIFLCYAMLRPLLTAYRREGTAAHAIGLLVFFGVIAAALSRAAPVVALLVSGGVTGLLLWRLLVRSR